MTNIASLPIVTPEINAYSHYKCILKLSSKLFPSTCIAWSWV